MQKKSMLIVDDVVINRLLLQEIFKGDFNIFLAENGLVALNILKEQNIDIIILDVIMPVMNGYEVLAVLQKDKKLAEIPVVVATSMSDVENEVKVLELGATDLITKPFDSKVIKRRVQNIIEKCEVEKVKIENLVLKQEQQAQIRLKAIMENMLNSVVLIECSDDFEILYKNKAYYNLIGVDENNYNENNDVLLQKMLSTQKLDFLKHVKSVLEREKSYTYEWRLLLENDVVLWLKLNFTKFNYIENKHPVILLMLTDITKEKTAELNLKFRADHDVLTEIYNRETFYRETEIMIKASPKTKFLLITSNIEKFKIINDLFGVRFGDNILKKYAKILQQHILGIGTYGRLDSDHFALCIPKKTLTNKKIDALIGSWIVEMQINYPLIIKYGLYEIIDTNMPINKMCDMANLAIQKIKGNYIQHFAFYNEDMLKLMMEEQEIVNKFNDALKNKEFVVYFQPVYSVSTNMPISAEALIRWKQPDGSLLSPAKFIPIAEKNGFITKIDYFVWDYVCKFLSQRIKANKPITPISVNVSRLNLYNPNLVNDILAITQKYNITHNLIKFEITESAYTSNPEIMQKFIAQMHKLNFEILMDDFGSGYSSLNMLKDLHVDYLKIDMKFLCDLEKSSRAGCILISISRMAKWLKLPIIYEGVETVNEINFLKSIGCERIQGYYFSPPVSVSAFSILINNIIQIPLVANSITPSLIDFDYLFNGNNFVAKFFDSVNFGIAFYEYSDETCELIRSNSAFNTLFTTASTLANNNVLKLMNKEELKQFSNAVITARQTCKPSEFIHKKITAAGIAITLRVAISILGSLDDKYILCIVINDINTTNYKLPTTETKAIKLAISEHKLQSYMPTFLSMFADIIEIDFDTNDLKVLYTHYGDKANLNKSRNFSATLEHWIKTFLHPEDASNFYNYIKKIPLNDTTAPENFQYRIVVNGAVTWMSFSSANIEKNKYLCYSKEITKEKEFTKILQQNASLQHENFEKARYQIIVESSNMIVMEWDIVNDNFYRSKGFEKYAICYEQPNELFNGKANLSVVHSEDVGLLNKFISDSKDPLVKAITKTLRLKTTNNTYEWCRLLGNFICNEQGKRVRIIATITNIDKEIKAQTEIRKANALLNSISDNIFGGIGIFEIIGATTRATYLNAGYYKMLGYKNKEDFGAHAINTIKDMHPEDIDTVLDSVEKSIQTKKPITFTYRAKQKSGNYIWIKALTTYQEMSQEGNPILLSILIDTTQETQNSRLLTEATNTLNSIMDNLPMGIVIVKLVSNNALILYASEQTYSIVGYSKLYMRNIIDNKLPVQFLKVHDVNGVSIKNYLPQHGVFDFNFEHIKPANGKKVWLNVAGKVVETNKDESIIYGIISDATDSITQQKENMKMQELYKMIIREAHMFVFDYDVEKDVLSYSMQDYEQTNKVKKIASFRNKLAHLTTIHPDDISAFYNIISEGAKKPISGQQDFRAKFGNKEYRWHKGFYKSISDSTDKVFRIIGSSRDTQNEVDLILNLKNKAKLDPMTLLLNKGAVIEMVNNLILEKNNDTYAALLLDIDNFKSINDAFGHLEGDKVLIEVANVLKNEFYGKDVVGRIGGDEFFVFFNVTNNCTLAVKKANSLLEKIRNLNNNKKIARPITVSIGIAYSKDSTRKFEDIFGQSDVALYEAKAKSRDAYFVLE